jgi:hypothetical protein
MPSQLGSEAHAVLPRKSRLSLRFSTSTCHSEEVAAATDEERFSLPVVSVVVFTKEVV